MFEKSELNGMSLVCCCLLMRNNKITNIQTKQLCNQVLLDLLEWRLLLKLGPLPESIITCTHSWKKANTIQKFSKKYQKWYTIDAQGAIFAIFKYSHFGHFQQFKHLQF